MVLLGGYGWLWDAPFINSTHGSNAQAVRDWMQSKGKQIGGVEVVNAYWVIYNYFGANMLSKVIAEPDKFYLVLEPTVTAQLSVAKQDMSYDSIGIANN